MLYKSIVYKEIILIIVSIILLNSIIPAIASKDIKGFDKGVSYKPVVPLKKVAFVNFDENSYLDDYAYLACVPTTVFYDGNANLFSYPLLFYQDSYPVKEDKERSLNARQGLDYFMEDWMSYCNGKLDGMTLINVPRDKVKQWPSRNIVEIKSDDPYEIAAKLALNDWSYSDKAVVAVIEKDFEKSDYELSGRLSGKIPAMEIKNVHFEVPQTNQLNPIYNSFEVPNGYKYLRARVWYPCVYIHIAFGAFQSLANISIPSGDKDLQLYCKYNDDWMEASAVAGWNQKFGMDIDITESYVYKNGDWRVAVTDIPTKGITTGRYGSFIDIIRNLRKVTYQVDVDVFPGVVIPIEDKPPYGCRDATFKLMWDNPNVKLGFSLIGPSNEEVLSEFNESREGYQEMHLDQLGECLEGENYSICVYSRDSLNQPVSFKVEYSWKQGITKEEGDSLSSATEGAVLASTLNAPLLYISPNEIPECTKNAMYKLGVKHIYLIDIDGNLKTDLINEMETIAKIKRYTVLREVYDDIRGKTGSNDVVFTTIDPWSYWYVGELKPAGEYSGALFIGPAAYIAAHHGTPVLIIDNHPELSSAVVWHNEFWKRAAIDPTENDPSIAEMYLTGKRVYNFLDKYGFDQKGRETIISVADQYDIGPSWDRMFVGVAIPGKFLFSPVDISYWIARNVFYPGLIFINPAMNPKGVKLINGSKSVRRKVFAHGAHGLKIIKESDEEIFRYPVHLTFASYQYRFNERASKYYGFKYQCADGIVPGETRTFEPIDQNSIKKCTGIEGCFWPDIDTSNVVPFYMRKGGYGCAFASNFTATVENLNRGVIYWYLASHGAHVDSGLMIFWDPTQEGASRKGCAAMPPPLSNAPKKELNPWRSYDWYLGSTEEPDTMVAEIHGVIPTLLGDPNMNGFLRSAFDWGPAIMPIRDDIASILAKIPLIRRILPEWFIDTDDYHDGQICGGFLSTFGYTWYSGWALDDALKNLHSMVFLTGVCLTGTKYAHTAVVRHGSVAQIIDPWPTSWYGSVWMQSVPRDIILGDTVGEACAKGLSHVGILYLDNDEYPHRWWWDTAENVLYYGDPNLRMFVPSTEYSDANHWEREDVKPLRYDSKASIEGHMLYGATSYPHALQPLPIVSIVVVVILLVAVITVIAVTLKKQGKREVKEK